MITIEVLGVPAPKGSGRAIMQGGFARHVASGSDKNREQLKHWDSALRQAAKEAVGDVTAPPFIAKPLKLTIVFRLTRPAGHYSKATGKLLPSAPAFPITKPDSSKLLRSTEDTLTGIVFDDDSRIVSSHIHKIFALPGSAGATIWIDEMKKVEVM